MIQPNAEATVATGAAWRLELGLQLVSGGPDVMYEPVTDADLADMQSEVWFDCCLRKGFPDCPMEALSFQIVPILKSAGDEVASGFFLQSADPAGNPVRLCFSIYSLQHVAERASIRMIAAGLLKPGDLYWYRILPRRNVAGQAPSSPAARAAAQIRISEDTPPLQFLVVPLSALEERATPVQVGESHDRYPVFYTSPPFEKAERLSRSGASFQPPVETGALLLGVLCACPETGSIFAVITHVLELRDAAQKTYSLMPSGQTWRRVAAVIRAMQSQPATRCHLPIGQCHGHNFPPGDMLVNLKTSAFVSADDRVWNSAVFPRAPYQLCHVFGLDREGNGVHKLFGLEDGRLLERGFHLVDDFDPEPYQRKVVTCVQRNTEEESERCTDATAR